MAEAEPTATSVFNIESPELK